MKKKIIWGTIIIVLIGGSIAAWYAWSEYERKPKTAADLPTAFKIDAAELMDEFVKDQEAASAKYEKTKKNEEAIEISGTIFEVKSEDPEQLMILFETNAESDIPDLPAPNVIVTFEPNMKDEISKLKGGDKATVRGIYSGFDTDVKLNRGEIIK